MNEDPRVECIVRRKRLTSGLHRWRSDEAIETDNLSTKIEAGEPSSSIRARVTEEAQSGILEMVDIEDHLLRSDPSVG